MTAFNAGNLKDRIMRDSFPSESIAKLFRDIGDSCVNNNVETVAATNAITADESGSTFFLSHATEFDSTLPAPAAGLRYRFIVAAAPVGAAYTVTATAAVVEGLAVVNGATVAAANESLITFTASAAVVGDWCEVVSDGTSWFVSGQAQAATGIAFTAP